VGAGDADIGEGSNFAEGLTLGRAWSVGVKAFDISNFFASS
jgi:hypothetical protein